MIGSNGGLENPNELNNKEMLFIPSRLVSRICTPSNIFAEIPFIESLPMSFLLEVDEPVDLNSSQSTAPNHLELLKQLETMKIEVDEIKHKLETNLVILQQKVEFQNDLKKQVVSKFNLRGLVHKSEIIECESMSCTCSKGCFIV